KYKAQLEAYKLMEEEELFDVQEVEVRLRPEDMPGRPLSRVRCESCGEFVQDKREVIQGDKILCFPCANGGYFIKK
ncbi:MAG: TraR/DksA C4-type zinc finger protein, partial [Thermodesulfovibrionales bacterium]|nr:TraR/DksA C4-type zinc finger protein [Thermodesulfovibrionales bacterium]